MKRENQKLEYIWDAMIQERNYQDTHKGIDGKNKHDIPGWVLIMRKQLDTAVMEWIDGDVDKSLAEILQATAVGVACLQQHGVPDAALRHIKGEIMVEVAASASWVETKEAPLEVDIKGFEKYKTYAWHDMYLIRFSDFSEEKQKGLRKFMRGQTMPTVVGTDDPYGWIYLRDFDNFLAGGKLFWDQPSNSRKPNDNGELNA